MPRLRLGAAGIEVSKMVAGELSPEERERLWKSVEYSLEGVKRGISELKEYEKDIYGVGGVEYNVKRRSASGARFTMYRIRDVVGRLERDVSNMDDLLLRLMKEEGSSPRGSAAAPREALPW